VVGLIAALLQLALALFLDPRLVILLLAVWAYLGLMSAEFFAKRWLSARPLHYMWTHMLIMPLIDLYATACDWLAAGGAALTHPPGGLVWFLLVSFFNGFVIEIGRKVRAPADEEPGVTTYTAAWGMTRAVCAWLGAILMTAVFATLAARTIRFTIPVVVLLGVLVALAATVALRFLAEPTRGRSKVIEAAAGVWTLLMYLSLGAIPLLVRVIRHAG
jgi:4-hydroxybenzoate polyprenyltransferase